MRLLRCYGKRFGSIFAASVVLCELNQQLPTIFLLLQAGFLPHNVALGMYVYGKFLVHVCKSVVGCCGMCFISSVCSVRGRYSFAFVY